MVEIARQAAPRAHRRTLQPLGIKDITVVRGYRKEAVKLPT